MKKSVSIALVEEVLLLRKGLSSVLNEGDAVSQLYEFENESDLFSLLKKTSLDLAIIGISILEKENMDLLKKLNSNYPNVKVISFLDTMHHPSYLKVLRLGVRGCIRTNHLPDQILNVIQKVLESGFYIEEDILKEVLVKVQSGESKSKREPATLSKREIQVLQELCNGKTEKEIAVELNISPYTVHYHKMNIYQKTDTHNLAGLLKYARHIA